METIHVNNSNINCPLRNIFNYIIFTKNYNNEICCKVDEQNLLNFLTHLELNYELKESLGILNVWFDGKLYLFPINNKGLHIINQQHFNMLFYEAYLSPYHYYSYYSYYKEIIWHSDYKPLYDCPEECLVDIFSKLINLNFVLENISLQDIYYSKEQNSICYLNTGFIYDRPPSIVYEPYKFFLGKYPYRTDNKELFSFKEFLFYVDSPHCRNFNRINYTGEY